MCENTFTDNGNVVDLFDGQPAYSCLMLSSFF